MEKQTLQIQLYPSRSTALIESKIKLSSIEPVRELRFLLNKNVREISVKKSGESLKFQFLRDTDLNFFLSEKDSAYKNEYNLAGELIISPQTPFKDGEIEIAYLLSASDSVDKAAFSREYIAYEVKAYIGEKGVFMSPAYFWYPALPNELLHFDVTVVTPDTLQMLTQGKLMREEILGDRRYTRWLSDYPADGLHLVGSRYMVGKTVSGEVDIYTYFFPESQDLSDSYLQASQRYVKMYEDLIGPYPFSKFAVVENFFPTGYGMPSYTLLGSQVIRLPFIIHTSLGHEITHNWWGNSVYVKYETGNWCEGLTTYYADHYYKEMKNPAEAADYRRDLNRDFTVYVKDHKDFPLNSFTERTESASRAIGYGKSAMVFHQLRQIVGDSLFYEIFRDFYRNYKFKEAGWPDIELSAEKTFKSDLTWFFDQWINRKGGPRLTLVSAQEENGSLWFTLRQEQNDLYRLLVPVEIVYRDSSSEIREVWLENSEQQYNFVLTEDPVHLIIDPNYDVFRTLSLSEIPPSLAEMYAQENALVVLPDNCSASRLEMYRRFAEIFSEGETNLTIESAADLSMRELKTGSLYLLGTPVENSLIRQIDWQEQDEWQLKENTIVLNEQPVPQPDEVVVLAGRTANENQNACIIAVGGNGKTGRIATLLSHYGKYSYLVFENGKNIIKDIYSVRKNPMMAEF
ncbi:MAG: M1 family peptidase [Calditrichaeota bacterium]|nr:hypothetical protein [Calditrichota bacterium]RQW07097.1 MAG: M1 family peptidase [Calditrichota bacterium]